MSCSTFTLPESAILIEPAALDASRVSKVTGIDGSVVVDPTGRCPAAIGVSLDGTATSLGDRSRGARYNSAVKHLASTDAATVILLVSEDGMTDLLPKLSTDDDRPLNAGAPRGGNSGGGGSSRPRHGGP